MVFTGRALQQPTDRPTREFSETQDAVSVFLGDAWLGPLTTQTGLIKTDLDVSQNDEHVLLFIFYLLITLNVQCSIEHK